MGMDYGRGRLEVGRAEKGREGIKETEAKGWLNEVRKKGKEGRDRKGGSGKGRGGEWKVGEVGM